jgi:HEAT repeat protein
MSKRRKRIILLACGILAFALVWALLARREPDPSYQGRTLSQWLDRIQQSADGTIWAETVIRAIGTNAIPTCLKWISYEASPLRNKFTALAERLPTDLTPHFLFIAQERAHRAAAVFEILGPEARAAIPELTRLTQTSSDPERADRCIHVLSHLGPEAVPSLLTLVTNNQAATRRFAIVQVHSLGTNAVPVLLPLLTDPDPALRFLATNALLQIAPEVLTNAPPQ